MYFYNLNSNQYENFTLVFQMAIVYKLFWNKNIPFKKLVQVFDDVLTKCKQINLPMFYLYFEQ